MRQPMLPQNTTSLSVEEGSTSPAQDLEPIRILEVEISQPLPAVSALDEATGRKYRRAISLVRMHSQPLGVVSLEELGEQGLAAADYARRIWDALGPEIREHLQREGLPEVAELGTGGLPLAGPSREEQERAAFWAHAPLASVIVATRDRPTNLVTCLDALLAMDYPNFEIIVVDNAPSSNATADLIQHAYGDLPQVHYVREDWPGLSAAHNRGLKEVNAPIVAFTDDDVIVDRHWLTEMVKAFDVAEQVGCVTGMICPIELETPSQIWFEQYGGFSKGFVRRIYDMAENRPEGSLYPYTAGMFGSGASMAFKTSALRHIGGFDPALGTGTPARGGDDLAIFFQIVANGYKLVYEPAAIARHSHRRNYAGLRKQMHDYGVGLSAYLTSLLLDRPRFFFDMALKAPRGVSFALSPRSPKNAKKRASYPKELTTLERRGMLYGPLAYLRSLRKTSRIRQQIGSLENSAKTSSPSTPLTDEARQP